MRAATVQNARAMIATIGTAIALGTPLQAQEAPQQKVTLNFYGVPGLVDMPTAQSLPDGEITFTSSLFGRFNRNTLTFQIAPWLQGSFRYSGTRGLTLGGFGPNDTYYDRSFDIRVRLLEEQRWWPSVTVGLQDFIGTGNSAGEYVVATKQLGDRLRVTAGLGWGRLGSYRALGAPFGARPPVAIGTGGKPNFSQWFRGPAAPFGGIEWQATDRLGLKLEYASDAYTLEAGQGLLNRRSPLNFGAEYQVNDALRVGAYYLYGSTVGISAQIALNPRRPIVRGVVGPAPQPLVRRPAQPGTAGQWSESWTQAATPAELPARYRTQLAEALKADGLELETLAVSARAAELRLRNPRYDSNAQAIGRAARALAATMPHSVETFDIVLVAQGMGLSRVRVERSDLEALEHAPDNAAALRARMQISDAAARAPDAIRGEGLYPRFRWSLGPALKYQLFDPSGPVRADLGVRLKTRLDLAPGLIASASVTQKLVGNLDKYNRPSNSVLPRVRTEDYLYDRRGFAVERLQLAWYSRPGRDLYGRVTAGYLERGFAGVSGEVLWKPVDSPLAFGAEVNYVRKRAFDSTFGLGTYTVATGHVSAYYSFRNGFHAQLDVGRYLAGDVGATLSLDREFANGWRVGAFATLTNVSAARFGEGSFDKGIRLSIPITWGTGTPGRSVYSTEIRPVQRDGGARLRVDGRLYETVRGAHSPRLDQQWGRVWR